MLAWDDARPYSLARSIPPSFATNLAFSAHFRVGANKYDTVDFAEHFSNPAGAKIPPGGKSRSTNLGHLSPWELGLFRTIRFDALCLVANFGLGKSIEGYMARVRLRTQVSRWQNDSDGESGLAAMFHFEWLAA